MESSKTFDLAELLQFCTAFKWIHNTKVTDFFIDKPWLKMPEGWLTALKSLSIKQLNELPYGIINPEWPKTLQQFCLKATQIKLNQQVENAHDIVVIPNGIKKGMSAKKQHEISRLAPLIHQICLENQSQTVVDVGCGLGYLGQVLQSVFGLNVIGFELSAQHCQGATARVHKALHTSDKIRTFQMTVDDTATCTGVIHRYLQESPAPTNRVVMVGLHCCADLSPHMLKQFYQIQECVAMVCMGCCYHRMSQDDAQHFHHFPLSNKLQGLYSLISENHKSTTNINCYSMRLACQETAARWTSQTEQDHDNHQRHVGYRAVIEYFCQRSGTKLIKSHKRLVTSDKFSNFGSYVDALLLRVLNSDLEKNALKVGIERCYEECKDYFEYIEPYTALQVMMQGALEALILHDRLQHLNEVGLHSKLTEVFDANISPRNIAIVSWKNEL